MLFAHVFTGRHQINIKLMALKIADDKTLVLLYHHVFSMAYERTLDLSSNFGKDVPNL